jgi:hypothetical protein
MRGWAQLTAFRTLPAFDQPDQSAKLIQLNIKSEKIRRRNLAFAKRGEYLSALCAVGHAFQPDVRLESLNYTWPITSVGPPSHQEINIRTQA